MILRSVVWLSHLGLILAFVVGCRFERREDFDFSIDQPLRCGIFKSYYFVREVKEEIYPDLGLLYANRARLELSEDQSQAILTRARQCTELCEVEKDNLRLLQEAIKEKLALNEIKGDLHLLAKEVREFEAAKAQWLAAHRERYHQGVALLTEAQRARWVLGERSLKPFPNTATIR